MNLKNVINKEKIQKANKLLFLKLEMLFISVNCKIEQNSFIDKETKKKGKNS